MREDVSEVFPAVMPSGYNTRAMDVKRFINRLNAVTEQFGIFNEFSQDKAITVNTLQQTGLWLGFDELPENGSRADVRVLWHMHPETPKRYPMSVPEWNRLRYYWWQMVMHELVHRAQDVFRTPDGDIKSFKPLTTDRERKEEQRYYGNYDEIEAHSHDAAFEFMSWWPDCSYRDAVFQATTYTGRIIMPTYCFYVAAFDGPKHPAMLTFKRKCRAWWDELSGYRDFYALLQLPRLV